MDLVRVRVMVRPYLREKSFNYITDFSWGVPANVKVSLTDFTGVACIDYVAPIGANRRSEV